MPPSRPEAPKNARRRVFLQLALLASAVLTIVPFVPWGTFLSSTASSSSKATRQAVVIDDNPTLWGPAAGKTVNVNDLTTFPPNNHWVVTYPTSGNPTLDAQNPDTFIKFELIRLPAGGPVGGDNKAASDFIALSKVCVHLWCSPSYVPANQNYECPCHGSIYECTGVLPDASTKSAGIPPGKAIHGPASLQPAPTNAIPMLRLTTDPDGALYIEIPVWDVDHNGVIGYGRDEDSYCSFINPNAQGALCPSGA